MSKVSNLPISFNFTESSHYQKQSCLEESRAEGKHSFNYRQNFQGCKVL